MTDRSASRRDHPHRALQRRESPRLHPTVNSVLINEGNRAGDRVGVPMRTSARRRSPPLWTLLRRTKTRNADWLTPGGIHSAGAAAGAAASTSTGPGRQSSGRTGRRRPCSPAERAVTVTGLVVTAIRQAVCTFTTSLGSPSGQKARTGMYLIDRGCGAGGQVVRASWIPITDCPTATGARAWRWRRASGGQPRSPPARSAPARPIRSGR